MDRWDEVDGIRIDIHSRYGTMWIIDTDESRDTIDEDEGIRESIYVISSSM